MVRTLHRWLRADRGRVRVGIALAGLLALASCAPQGTTATTADPGTTSPPLAEPTSTTAAAEPVDLQLSFASSSSLGFADVPLMSALNALEADETGVTVELIAFNDTATSTQALVQGQVDIAIINVPGLTAANNQGADLLVFFNGKNNEWNLATSVDITDPSQLDGLRIAHHGVGLTEALALLVSNEYDVEPIYLAVPGSENRVQALIQGQIDAAPVDAAGLVTLERLAPGQFHSLIRYADVTDLVANHYTASRDVLVENPAGWAILTKYLACYNTRAAEDPEWLTQATLDLLPNFDPEEAAAASQEYAERDVWRRSGQLPADDYESMMSFYVDSGLVAAEEALDYEEFMLSDYVDEAARDIEANGCPF